MSDIKNIVIAIAAGYNIDNIRNFVLSFREHNTVDRMLVIVDMETKPVLLDFLNEHNVELLVFSSFRFIQSYINNSRWGFLTDYFINSGVQQFKNVLLSDIRDVIFQSNPFENLPEEFLYFFTEDIGIPIIEEGSNTHWIRVTYGDDVLSNLERKNIICGGTILGSSKLLTDYIIWVYNEYVKFRYNNLESFNTQILDQAICNYFVYVIAVEYPHVQIKYNGDLVGTVGLSLIRTEAHDIVSIHTGKVLVNGCMPAIIHQYDRSPILTDFINKKYVNNQRIHLN